MHESSQFASKLRFALTIANYVGYCRFKTVSLRSAKFFDLFLTGLFIPLIFLQRLNISLGNFLVKRITARCQSFIKL